MRGAERLRGKVARGRLCKGIVAWHEQVVIDIFAYPGGNAAILARTGLLSELSLINAWKSPTIIDGIKLYRSTPAAVIIRISNPTGRC